MGKRNYITYFTLSNGSFRYMASDSEEIGTYVTIPDNIKHKYTMFKGYDATDDGLILFTKDFERWNNELKTNPICKLDYTFYFTHHIAVEAIFKKYSSEQDNHLTSKKWIVEPVTVIEESYMSKCFNGGLTYCEEYEGQCYGYDYNSFYPRMLANDTFEIPTQQGIEKYTDVKYHMKNNTLQYGMYYVEIKSSKNPDTIDVRALKNFKEEFPNAHCYVLCRIPYPYKEEGVTLLPFQD